MEIQTSTFTADSPRFVKDQVYNGLDCCVTFEVWNTISKLPRSEASVSYNFTRAMQAPALEMMFRGVLTDRKQIKTSIEDMSGKVVNGEYFPGKIARVQSILDRYSMAVWGKLLNANSPQQLKAFFYGAMGFPEQYDYKKGVKTVTTNRDALERLASYYPAEPIVSAILAVKEMKKKVSVLSTEIDPDGRMRTSYNVVGTETGRWSSSENAFGFGTNLQNITNELRRGFISDPGWKLGYIDLSQAESRILGWLIFLLFGDSVYLDACEAGDLHTAVAKLVWPGLPWTGDRKLDRAIAEAKFYRDFSYRDMAKRGGHGTNYVGTAPTMAKHLKVAVGLIRDFQEGYLGAFPGIPRFWRWVAGELQISSKLTTILGRTRYFFGRPWDDATKREGVAYLPQSIVGELLNLALWRVWRYVREVQILGQLHDAILFQYRPEDEASILPVVRSYMPTPLKHEGREMVIPSDIEVGWNWAKADINNPFGMQKWTGSDGRTPPPEASGLDRSLLAVY